ncbi:hypothetical protein ZIOFF_046134 [Zingiber officinale]|uniref:NAD(P)-binding protein n=1 Tax=Zingiber officinale TaxID=94328 RepID=A0A8J5KZ03_ZINOF|nr:hypothetical protein ZIOFF_046134 [Zingiber officinale]
MGLCLSGFTAVRVSRIGCVIAYAMSDRLPDVLAHPSTCKELDRETYPKPIDYMATALPLSDCIAIVTGASCSIGPRYHLPPCLPQSLVYASNSAAADQLTAKLNSSPPTNLPAPSPSTLMVYAASKAAVEAMVKVLEKELKGTGIATNCVAPGPVATEMFFAEKSEELVKRSVHWDVAGGLGHRASGGVPVHRRRRVGELAGGLQFTAVLARFGLSSIGRVTAYPVRLT